MTVRIIEGDCREMLATLPDQSVHCCVTSPPYFGLRDYGVDGQMGLVADRLQRDATLIELNPAYAEIARKRLHGDAGMFAEIAA